MHITPEGVLLLAAALVGAPGLIWLKSWTASSSLREAIKKLRRQIDELGNKIVGQTDTIKGLEIGRRDAEALAETRREAYEAVGKLKTALAEMDRVWLRHGHTSTKSLEIPKHELQPGDDAAEPQEKNGVNEESCEVILRDYPWAWCPELIPTAKINKSSRIGLRRILSEQFGVHLDKPPDWKMVVNLNWKPDICGWFTSRSIQRGLPHNEETYVVIELKHSRSVHNRSAMEQCLTYAQALMLCAPEQLWGKRIECFVVCGAYDPSGPVHPIESNFGEDRHGHIRVTPLTYKELYGRARQTVKSLELTGLIPELSKTVDEQMDNVIDLEQKRVA